MYGTQWVAPGVGATVRELLDFAPSFAVSTDQFLKLTPSFGQKTDLALTGEGCSMYDVERIREALRRVLEA